MCHTTCVVDQQLLLPDYRRWNSIFSHINRRINLHKDTKSNGRSTWRILYIQRYIDTDKIYLRYRISSMLLVWVIHQYNNPQGRVETMLDQSLLFIKSKWAQGYNFHSLHIWHTGNCRQTTNNGYYWIHQEIICNLINEWIIGLNRI